MARGYYILVNKLGFHEADSVIFTNLSKLSKFSGISYNTLIYHFSRKGRTYYEDRFTGMIVVRSYQLVKGDQRVLKRRLSDSYNFK